MHVSHDAWVEEEKEDVPMQPLSQKEVCCSTLPRFDTFHHMHEVRDNAMSGDSTDR